MAAHAQSVSPEPRTLRLELVADIPKLRALAWDGDVLYASRGYELFRGRAASDGFKWQKVSDYRPKWWRNLTRRSALSYRLFRDGFHALAILPQGNLIAAVPGAIITLQGNDNQFHVSHRLRRGTRPLHIATTPDGHAFWGEYFDNADRDEVFIYGSSDAGITWNVAHTFSKESIRHVHNVIYDRWDNCFWVFTGDYGSECRIMRASLDFRWLDEVLCGNQQARAVVAIIREEGIYFASDTPLEQNHIYLLDRSGRLQKMAAIPNSSIYACSNAAGMFFSTMVEPSKVNRGRKVALFGSENGLEWPQLASWRKDQWPMKFFQYGNAFLPAGKNSTDFLAVSTIAVHDADLQTSIWRAVAD